MLLVDPTAVKATSARRCLGLGRVPTLSQSSRRLTLADILFTEAQLLGVATP